MNFEVNRQDVRQTRVVEPTTSVLDSGHVRLAIERFAVTTNNISYAVAGDLLDYWGFFPVDTEWGRVPVMGLASVVESAHPDIAVGGRYFGFYPMAEQVVISARSTSQGFADDGPHRSAHAAVYTNFRDVETDPTFRADMANEYLLLWGMFMTSFLVDDYLADNDFHQAHHTLITSASSKTSISLASCIARRDDHSTIGLTSQRNRAFVEGLGLYDQVITYDQVGELDASAPSGMVDMAGSATVRSNVHHHFGDSLKFSLTVGATHWEDRGGDAGLPGPNPEFFFAPSQSAKRAADWGPQELAARIDDAFNTLLDSTTDWMTVEHLTGAEGMQQVYDSLVNGNANPAVGFVVSMKAQS